MGRSSWGLAPYLGKEHNKTVVVGEVQVLGIELMESGDVTLDELLLLIVQLVQVCGKQPVTTETLGLSCCKWWGEGTTSSPREHSPHDLG